MKIFTAIIIVFFLSVSVVSAVYTISGTISTQGSVPNAPQPVSAVKTGDSSILVDWDPVTGVSGYRIYRNIGGGSFTLLTETTSTSHTDSGLAEGVYSYQIQSFLGSLAPVLDDIIPTTPITIVVPTPTPTPTPTPSPEGGGGGGGGGSSTTPTPTPTPLSAAAQKVDVNDDNKEDVLDFNVLIVNWGSTSSGNTADFNGDSKVDILDFNFLMVNWSL